MSQPARSVRPGRSLTLWIPCADGSANGWSTPSIVDAPDHGTLTDLGFGEYFKYTPNAGYTGPDAAVLRLTTRAGQAEVKLSIDVTASANVPPGCYADPPRVTRGPVGFTRSCNDGDGDELTFALSDPPDNGVISGDVARGSGTYTPNAGFAGLEKFTYTASDGHGGSASVEHTIRVRSPEGNVRPICRGGGYGGSVNQPLSMMRVCEDADGDPLTLEVTVPPQHGTIAEDWPGQLIWTPHTGFVGRDYLTVVADDGRSKSAPTTISFESRDYNQPQPPICRPLAANVAVGMARPLELKCQFPGDWDMEIIQHPEHGGLSAIAADGTVTYTPHPGYTGQDAFLYRPKKGGVIGQPALVTLDVKDAVPLPEDVTDERAIGPEPRPDPTPTPDPDSKPDPETKPDPAKPGPDGGTPAPPARVTPQVLAPSLRDVALQAMKTALRAVTADLGNAQVFVAAATPKPGTRRTKMLAIACPQACTARVKAKLVAGRRSAPMGTQSKPVAKGAAVAFGYGITAAQRRRLGRPKRAVLILDVNLRDADGTTHRSQIRVRVVLR
jgi:hypothetical protein